MAKKNKGLKLSSIVSLGAIVMAIVAFFLMFAPAVKGSFTIGGFKLGEKTYTGADIAFGYTYTGELTSTKYEVFAFSFMNCLPYLLLLIGVVFSGLAAFGKLGKIAPVVAAACYLVAGVFFFCAVPFTQFHTDSADAAAEMRKLLSLQAGVIVSGILAILSSLSSVSALFIKK